MRTRFIAAALTVAGLVGPAADAGAAEIMNTLRGLDRTAVGWSGALTASFQQEGGNTEKLQVGGGIRAQWLRDPQRVRFFASADHEESGGARTSQAISLHLRHNYRLTESRLHSLLFAQAQRDPFQRLEARTLLGSGARVDLVERESFHGAIGAAHMLEFEKLEDRDDVVLDHRLSTFATVAGDLGANAGLDLVVFMQPLWEDFTDVRAIAQAALEVAVVSRLSVVLAYEVTHDTEPPDDVKDTDWKATTGFTWKL
jgi:putative salt-induced outer membrane protein YdiY